MVERGRQEQLDGRVRPKLAWLLVLGCFAVTTACDTGPSVAQQVTNALNAGLNAQLHGRTDEARADYHKVLALDPRNKFAYYDLGVIDQSSVLYVSAETNYRAALQTDPNFVPALFNLAIIRTTPSPLEAVDLYSHVISVNPNYATAYLNLGFLLISIGRTADGMADLNRAVLLDPSLKSRLPTPSPSPSRKP